MDRKIVDPDPYFPPALRSRKTVRFSEQIIREFKIRRQRQRRERH